MSGSAESFTIRIVRKFLDSNLSVVFILVSIAVGVIALVATPREEEPQITVAAANVMVAFPGHSAQDVEQLVSTPIERMLLQVPGVQYVYSRSMPGQSIVTVRFFVGQPLEASYVKLVRKLNENADRTVPGAAGWVVKPIDVDDVPIVTFTLTGGGHDDFALRRMADEVVARLQGVENAGVAYVVGGRPRELLVRPSAARMASYRISAGDLGRAIQGANTSVLAGAFNRSDQNARVQVGQFIADARDLQNLVVGVWSGRPVYLRDVADVADGPGEYTDYVRFHRGRAWDHAKEEGAAGSLLGEPRPSSAEPRGDAQPAVTIAVAKKHGTNNVWVAASLLTRMDELRRTILPANVEVVVTRNYGVTANDKVTELEEGLLVAIAVVMALLAIGLGYRQALVVAVAVPCVFGLTLAVNYLFGFSINRISLFALTIALGLLVDDPIVDVENIHRHFQLRGRATADVVLEAVNEVRPPLIAATFAVILSFLPLLFVTDMMGQYLRPMAVNVPVTMLMSLLVSFTITPWLAYKLLKGQATEGASGGEHSESTRARRFFERTLTPLIARPRRGRVFLLVVVVLFAASVLLVLTRRVQVKQLPYDNKDEMLLVLDLPAGTTLERTDAAARDFEHYLRSVPEITDFETYVGTASPVDFNGLMRQYFLRRAPNRADIRVNLIHKTERAASSHSLALRMRGDLTALAERHRVKLKIVELPAGPPAMATVVAAVYGGPTNSYQDLMDAAAIVKARMRREPGVVDVDDTVEEDQTKHVFEVDRQKAAVSGISTDDIARTMALALGSQAVGAAQIAHERAPVRIALWFPRAERSSPLDLTRIYAKGSSGSLVPMSELGVWRTEVEDKTIYHRQLERVVYVLGEMAGRPPVETILDLAADEVHDRPRAFVDTEAPARALNARTMFRKGGGIPWQMPEGVTVRWWDEGEMYITIHLFRDLAVALLAALFAIYIILMNQTGSYGLPLTMMAAIPLMVIGVIPGFWLLNQLGSPLVGEFRNPVFFSGPAFMGMIALAGIVTRNSIIIVDFIQLGLLRGLSLDQAIVESVSVRLRPILLTSGAAVLGALPITLDTVFGGMAWSLIFGLIVSTVFSLFVIPVTYHLVYAGTPNQGLPEQVRRKLSAGLTPLVMIGVLLALLPSIARAADPPPLSLRDAVNYALQHSPELRLSRLEIERRQGIEATAAGMRWPQVDLAADAVRSRLQHGYPAGAAPSQLRYENTVFSGSADLKLLLWDFNKTGLELAATRERVEAARVMADRRQQEIVFETARLYLQTLAYEDLAVAAEARVRSLQSLLDRTNQLVEAGRAVPVDALKVHTRLAQVESDLASLRSGRRSSLSALASVMGLAGDLPQIAPSPASAENFAPAGAEAALVGQAIASRPELRAQDNEIRASSQAAEAIRKAGWPRIDLRASLIQYGSNRPVGFPQLIGSLLPGLGATSPPPGGGAADWVVGVRASFSLFDGGRRGGQSRVAQAQLEQTRLMREVLQLRITREVRTALADLESAEGRVTALRDSVKESERVLHDEQLKFEAGRSLVSFVLDAESALLTNQSLLSQAMHSVSTATLALDLALGRIEIDRLPRYD